MISTRGQKRVLILLCMLFLHPVLLGCCFFRPWVHISASKSVFYSSRVFFFLRFLYSVPSLLRVYLLCVTWMFFFFPVPIDSACLTVHKADLFSQCFCFFSSIFYMIAVLFFDFFPSLVHISDLFFRCSCFFPSLFRNDDLFSLSSPRPGHHRVQEGLRAAGRRGDGGAALWRRLAHVEAGGGTHGGGWRPCVWWVEGVMLGHVVYLLIHPSIYLSHHTQYLHKNKE